jgi:hypothetical protein
MRRIARLAAGTALVTGAVTVGVMGIGFVGSAMVAGAARALVLLLDTGVWMSVAMQEGVDWWSVAGRASAVIGQTLFTPRVMSGLIGLELLGAAAFYVLQRLLKDEERGGNSSKEKP